MHKPEPMDFKEVIARIKDAGGFADYPKDKWKDAPEPPSWIGRHPIGPGDGLYGNGPYIVDFIPFRELPQSSINENHKSFRDAINAFLPNDTIAQWMCQYFSNPDFLRSKVLAQEIENVQWIGLQFILRENLTGKLDHSERKGRRDRALYTIPEIYGSTVKVCKDHLALPLAIVAYEASLYTYLQQLKEEIKKSDDLSDLEKQIGEDVIGNLESNFRSEPASSPSSKSGNNFVDFILPGIALQYERRAKEKHSGDYAIPLAEQDFIKGIQFERESGMFNHDVIDQHHGNVKKRFRCPAGTFVLNSMRAPVIEGAKSNEIGSTLYQIYRLIDEQIKAPNAPRIPAVDKMMKVLSATCPSEEILIINDQMNRG